LRRSTMSFLATLTLDLETDKNQLDYDRMCRGLGKTGLKARVVGSRTNQLPPNTFCGVFKGANAGQAIASLLTQVLDVFAECGASVAIYHFPLGGTNTTGKGGWYWRTGSHPKARRNVMNHE